MKWVGGDLPPDTVQKKIGRHVHSCFVFLRGELTEKNDLHSCTARLHMLNSSSAIAMSKVLLVVDRPNSRPGNGLVQGSSILSTRLFFIFFKKNYRNIFLILYFTVLYPYRPAGGRQTARQGGGRPPAAPLPGGRDLFVNKNKIYLRIRPW